MNERFDFEDFSGVRHAGQLIAMRELLGADV